jgi:transposase
MHVPATRHCTLVPRAGRHLLSAWAVEGADGLGRPPVTRLTADGITAVDVPARLSARVRLLSTGHGRKNDAADATSVAVAALTSTGLRTAAVDEHAAALRALTDHRDDPVRTRTQNLNRLHRLLVDLLPGSAPQRLTAEFASELVRGLRPTVLLARTRRQLASDLIAEVRRQDRRIAAATDQISAAVADSGTSLTQLFGLGDLTAAKILARVGDINRFASPAQFA